MIHIKDIIKKQYWNLTKKEMIEKLKKNIINLNLNK